MSVKTYRPQKQVKDAHIKSTNEPKGQMKSGLYLIATPIGNLKDITYRAIETLKAVDMIACEDTRVTAKICQAYNITTHRMSYHEHSSAKAQQNMITHLKEGKSIALVSDSGTPLISDPGYKIVKACLEEGISVTSLPGPSSTLTALSLSGLPTDQFYFAGFLPVKAGAKQRQLEKLKEITGTLIFFESPYRIEKSLQAIAEVFGERQVVIARELTKMFEEVIRGTAAEILQQKITTKGEFVILIEGNKNAR